MASRSSPPIRIVIVDDNEEVRHLVALILHRYHGLELVGEAGDGMAAVDVVSKLRPDVVIMDVQMPRLNGIEATKQILARVPRAIVIGFSTYTDAATRAALHEAGSVWFVAKDEVFQLPRVIEEIIQASHLIPLSDQYPQ